VSGTVESMDRPAWQALMGSLHLDGVRTVIIERLDRLARDLVIQEKVIADLHKRGFVLLSAMEPDLMATDPTRVLMRQLLGAVSQYDKSQIVLKLRAARERMRESYGVCEGRKAFGTHPHEQAVLTRAITLRSQGLPYGQIASQLDVEGLRPRSGQRWYPATVRRILLANAAAGSTVD
jgi:DNA invertase Pin-like site-specific DNA recombinase